MNEEILKSQITDLMRQERDAIAKLTSITDAIKALRKLCPHTRETYLGHGHNDSLYECDLCRREVWR